MGLLGTYRDSVVLINRTSRTLFVRYDGEDMAIPPGENPGFPKVAVPYARKQNPLMGSKHPINPNRYISLVGVKDTKDDVTPISDATLALADTKLEVIDRSGEFHGEPMPKVKLLKRTGFDPYEAMTDLPNAFDTNPNIP